MGFGSIWHWVIVLLVVLVLFGRGRVSEIMGDFGKGIKSFKQGLNEEADRPATPPPAQLPAQGSAQGSTQQPPAADGDAVTESSQSKSQ